MNEEEFMSQEDFVSLMLSPQTTVELVSKSGLKIRTVRSRLSRLMQQGKIREIYTLKDMRMRRYVKVM